MKLKLIIDLVVFRSNPILRSPINAPYILNYNKYLMKALYLALATAAILASLHYLPSLMSSQVPPNPPKTVPYVDIDKYLGTWY